jgi:RNA polymerase sigma-70 factor (ECF subfamily)
MTMTGIGPADEQVWVARAKAGDAAAFAALVGRYEGRLRGFILRMVGDSDDAADLTQETLLRAYCGLARTDQRLNFSAWLHRIAANACLDLLRRRRRQARCPWHLVEGGQVSRCRDDDPEEAALDDETVRALSLALQGIDPRQRRALLLRGCAGLSCAEIGAALGVSTAATKTILFRGREALRVQVRTQERRDARVHPVSMLPAVAGSNTYRGQCPPAHADRAVVER